MVSSHLKTLQCSRLLTSPHHLLQKTPWCHQQESAGPGLQSHFCVYQLCSLGPVASPLWASFCSHRAEITTSRVADAKGLPLPSAQTTVRVVTVRMTRVGTGVGSSVREPSSQPPHTAGLVFPCQRRRRMLPRAPSWPPPRGQWAQSGQEKMSKIGAEAKLVVFPEPA